jgi:hypothetical protein
MTNEDFEPVRIRIMQEAYNLADRNDTEGYNSVKVMCSEVQNLLQRTEQEPVAWLDEYGNAFPLAAKQYSVVGKHWKPLYTFPQAQRKPLTEDELERFASLVRADMKEKCAKVCDQLALEDGLHQAKYCANAIRGRMDE